MTKIQPQFETLIIVFFYRFWHRNGSNTHLLVLFYILQLVYVKAGQISFISLVFIEILPFLIHFEPLMEPLMRIPTSFIRLLQLYNIDIMIFQNNFQTICKKALTFFPLIS